MKADNALRAALTRIIRTSRRVFALDDALSAGRAVNHDDDLAKRSALRIAIEDAERLLLGKK